MSAIISAIRRISGCMHGKSGLDRASSVIKFSHCPETQFRSIHSGYPQSDENPTEVGAPEGHSDLQFCVVGSGPSGFYTVSQLLKRFGDGVKVSLLERLPSPYGLVRSGVAPDHPDTKKVINQFAQLGADPRVTFFGNVKAGQDVSLSELRGLFNGVILAYGAESNKVLDIPGRHSEGIFPAREFVWWYNGHPEYCNLPINLKQVKRVAILGLGNVALDCARILLQPPERLKTTDIASHALQQLLESSVEQVDLIGRRGPAQAAFTAKELRELLRMEGIRVVIPKEGMLVSSLDLAEMKASRVRKRVYDLLQGATQAPGADGSDKQLNMRFMRTPVEMLSAQLGTVSGVTLEKTKLQREGSKQIAVCTGELETIHVDLVLESIGYKSLPMAGAPFDEQRGVIPNREGRVLMDVGADEVETGLYVCGWVKRGPSGIIGTNLTDASETVHAVAEDVAAGSLVGGHGPSAAKALLNLLEKKNVQVVTFQDWMKIDEEEKKNGQREGRERKKYIFIHDMLQVCQD